MKKWFICPYCKQKLIKYDEKAECKLVFIKCKKCKKQIEINIKNNK
nr:MAG TPA: cysteine-rich protein [Caudoviricetes sp.]